MEISTSEKFKAGSPAGRYVNNYCVITIEKKIYQVHRILYCLRNSCDLYHYEIINHIDHNPSNNKENNLEKVSYIVNNLKKAGYRDPSVGVKLVKGHAEARIMFNGVLFYKRIPINENGKELALTLAGNFRSKMIDIILSNSDNIVEDLLSLDGVYIPRRNHINGIRHRQGKRNCFEVYATIDGKLKTKHFSINKYGYDEAKRLAEQAKIEMQTLIN